MLDVGSDDERAFKREANEAREWLKLKLRTGRYSFGLLMELVQHALNRTYNTLSILDEIGFLEEPSTNRSLTKEAAQFSGPVLGGLWHKHHFQAGFMIENMTLEIRKSGFMQRICEPHFGKPFDEWRSQISYEMTTGSYLSRAKNRALTGEWIIFEKNAGRNYYLTLASHPRDSSTREMEEQQILNRINAYKQFDLEYNMESVLSR